jgi:alkylation response protein AidB-like acyl-CoA dehydrogenase
MVDDIHDHADVGRILELGGERGAVDDLETGAKKMVVMDLVAGKLDTETASMAKWWCSDMQQQVLDECVQLHGGYGYMNEYLVCRLFADSRVQRIYGGTNEIMKEVIARGL